MGKGHTVLPEDSMSKGEEEMSNYQGTALPPMPGTSAPEKKHNVVKIVAIIVAGIVALAIIGSLQHGGSGSTQGTNARSEFNQALDNYPVEVANYCVVYHEAQAAGLSDDALFNVDENAGAFDGFTGKVNLSDREVFDIINARC
jgi:hypothetical protein